MKKLNMCKIIGMGSLCLFLLGCSKESFLLQEADSSTMVLEETVVLGDIILRLSDTAGIRETDNVVEKIGVTKAKT